jgi:hypothetical protein
MQPHSDKYNTFAEPEVLHMTVSWLWLKIVYRRDRGEEQEPVMQPKKCWDNSNQTKTEITTMCATVTTLPCGSSMKFDAHNPTCMWTLKLSIQVRSKWDGDQPERLLQCLLEQLLKGCSTLDLHPGFGFQFSAQLSALNTQLHVPRWW